jgi:hypothetical protein
LEAEYPIWRIWLEKGTPLNELRHSWTYEDLMYANAILDMQADTEMALDGLLETERKKNGGGKK